MQNSWLDLVAGALQPARPDLERCLRERELHLAARRSLAERRARSLAECEASIERERAAVLAANDGVISLRMRELEREWLTLSRRDPDGERMDLWARIAPASWVDQKRWRDSGSDVREEAAIALAADVAGVEAAEAASESLREALAAWGVDAGPCIRWRAAAGDSACVSAFLVEPDRAARAALAGHDAERVILQRAWQIERAVHEEVRERLPRRPIFACELAHAAFVDYLFGAASLPGRPNPVAALRRILSTGYALAAVDRKGITLEIPPLPGEWRGAR